jgi:hypothetical protein
MGQGLFLWGAPIWVPREASAEDLEKKRLELEVTLNRMTAQADEAMRHT